MKKTICRLRPCFPSGTGSETFFRLRAAGYGATWGKGAWAVSYELGGWCGLLLD